MRESVFNSTKNEVFVIHFDDHRLFTEGVRISVEKERKNYSFHTINEYYSALKYISECLENNICIDAIITDLNHPGPNGYEFACEVKHIAKMHDKEIPVIVLTMSMGDNPRIIRGLEEGVFDKHLTKEAESFKIAEAIESLLPFDKKNMESSLQDQLSDALKESKDLKLKHPKLYKLERLYSNTGVAAGLVSFSLVVSLCVWLVIRFPNAGDLFIFLFYGGLFATAYLAEHLSPILKSLLLKYFKITNQQLQDFENLKSTLSTRRERIEREIKYEKMLQDRPVKQMSSITRGNPKNKSGSDQLMSKITPKENPDNSKSPKIIPSQPEIAISGQKVALKEENDKIVSLQPEKVTKPIRTPNEEVKTATQLFGESDKKKTEKKETVATNVGRSLIKIDFPKLNEHRHNIGELGELYVLEKEKKIFINQGQIERSKDIVHVSTESDAEGYDIRSFTTFGETKFIEVKTTTGNEFEPFYLSNTEMEAMKRLSNYWIYRVFNFNIELKKGDICQIDCGNHELEKYYHIKASSFKISPK